MIVNLGNSSGLENRTYSDHPLDREYGMTVLIVDDEDHAREKLRQALREIEGSNEFHLLSAKFPLTGATDFR